MASRPCFLSNAEPSIAMPTQHIAPFPPAPQPADDDQGNKFAFYYLMAALALAVLLAIIAPFVV